MDIIQFIKYLLKILHAIMTKHIKLNFFQSISIIPLPV